ncbi:hypothetical protein FACS189460_3120 [Deltaproteobacteria bacterium]|nr:hypothetical protein FACS189460_3120 [Deltaproteobacteria bacterium]
MIRNPAVIESPRLILLAGQYYLDRLLDNWLFKVLLSPLGLLYSSIFGGNWALLLFFYIALFIDLILGGLAAWRAGEFSLTRAGQWVVKTLTYTLCIFLMGMVNKSVAEVIGVNWLLDAFMGVMIVTEVLSIFRNMNEMGWPVPPLAVKLATKAQSRASRKLDELLGDEKGGDDVDGQKP